MKKQYEKFVCEYCDQTFITEGRYLKHYCEPMRRLDEIKTVNGQFAWSLYQRWLKFNRRKVPHINTFLKSQYYKSFMRFAEFVKSTQIPDVNMYIRLMLQHKLLPTCWTKNEIYNLYFEHLMEVMSPIKQVNISVKTLLQIADNLDIDTSETINVLEVTEILDLLRKRKLFPLILLKSKSFANKVEHANSEQRKMLQSLIQPTFWRDKISQPEINKLLQEYIVELGI